MSRIRLLVGTRKGAFVLSADGKRQNWTVSGPHFAGWEVYHVKGSPADPNRLYASQTSSWFGQVIQRSDDGGATWGPVDNKFVYDGVPGTHQWYDGTPHPWEFKRVWHLEPSLTDPDVVYAGVEDAALFRTSDGGHSWSELKGLRAHGSGSAVGARRRRHGPAHDPAGSDPAPIACTSRFRRPAFSEPTIMASTWRPVNKGLNSNTIANPTAEVGHCVHRIAMHKSRPDVLFMQKHWDVMRSDDGAESWREVSGNLPTDFGFPIDVHAHEPETIYVVPITSDSYHYPPDGKLRVFRSRTGGDEWEALTHGLPQEHCYVNVLRDAMSVDSLDACGVYFGTTGGQVYASADAGDTWNADRSRSAICAVGGGADARRDSRSASRRTCARSHESTARSALTCTPTVTQRTVLDALETRYPTLRGTMRDHVTLERRPFLRFFACEQDLSRDSPDTPLPDAARDASSRS